MDNLYITDDGGAVWLEHFPAGPGSANTCEESPICEVETGMSLAEVIAKAEAHTCGTSA